MIFLSEGIQKFLFADANGVGRFARIGIPLPEITAPFVAGVEIICGALILTGWLTRIASVPLLIDISVAILSTKIPILLGHAFWHFSLPKVSRYGFWSMAHEARTDFAGLSQFGGAGISAPSRLFASIAEEGRRKLGRFRPVRATQMVHASSIGLQRNVHAVGGLERSEQILVQISHLTTNGGNKSFSVTNDPAFPTTFFRLRRP